MPSLDESYSEKRLKSIILIFKISIEKICYG